MKRTQAWLADGREILYFDESDDAVRVLADPRDLPPTATRSEVRYDARLDEWVTVASHRQDRTYLPPEDECPLCPSRDGRHTEVPSPSYDVVVFENRFPSFGPRVELEGGPWAPGTEGPLFARGPGRGRCEVVCFTSDHDASFGRLSPQRVRTVVEAWVDRTRELGALPGVAEVFCFENRGREIGVTLAHPHGQVYAYPFLTPRTGQLMAAARRHREATGGNLLADLLAAERAAGLRVVATGAHWTAFVPAAARWPFEVHLHPHRDVPDLPALSDDERDDLAVVYLEVLGRLDALFDTPLPYIAAWHQAPVTVDRDLARLHLQVFSVRRSASKLKYLAGSESGLGAFINDISPEQAAQMLREATPGGAP